MMDVDFDCNLNLLKCALLYLSESDDVSRGIVIEWHIIDFVLWCEKKVGCSVLNEVNAVLINRYFSVIALRYRGKRDCLSVCSSHRDSVHYFLSWLWGERYGKCCQCRGRVFDTSPLMRYYSRETVTA